MATIQEFRLKRDSATDRCSMMAAGGCAGQTKPVVFSDGPGRLCSAHFSLLLSRLYQASSV